MPPGFVAHVGQLETFQLPSQVTGSKGDHALATALLSAWRRDGIFQIVMNDKQTDLSRRAFETSKKFFARPSFQKKTYVDPQSYAGYIASGEEITAGIADYSEIFTVTKDQDRDAHEVKNKWPCHGPCPWPDTQMKDVIKGFMSSIGESGEILLQLLQLGLGLQPGTLTDLTEDGWHHMRILR
jgi:isopenicillin N synthase-like dioxygenase